MIALLIVFLITLNLLFRFTQDSILYNFRYLFYLLIAWIIFTRILNRYLMNIYIDNKDNPVILINVLKFKKTIKINIKDIKKVDIKKDSMKLFYNVEKQDKVINIPITMGLDRGDFQFLINLFRENNIPYNHTFKINFKRQSLIIKIVNITFIIIEILLLVLVYGNYKGW